MFHHFLYFQEDMHELLELLLITPLAPIVLFSRGLIMRVNVRNQACRLMTLTVHVPIDISIPTSHSSNPRAPLIFNAPSTLPTSSLISIFCVF